MCRKSLHTTFHTTFFSLSDLLGFFTANFATRWNASISLIKRLLRRSTHFFTPPSRSFEQEKSKSDTKKCLKIYIFHSFPWLFSLPFCPPHENVLYDLNRVKGRICMWKFFIRSNATAHMCLRHNCFPHIHELNSQIHSRASPSRRSYSQQHLVFLRENRVKDVGKKKERFFKLRTWTVEK